MWKEIKRKVYEGRQGLLYGAITGLIVSFIIKAYPSFFGFDMSLLDLQSPLEQIGNFYLSYKLQIMSTVIGALIGFIIDLNKNRLPLPGWMRRRL